MTWNYRVLEFVELDGSPWQAIHEVFYDEQGNPTSYTEEPAAVTNTDLAGQTASLSWVLDRMREAITKPVLVEKDFARGSDQAGERHGEG